MQSAVAAGNLLKRILAVSFTLSDCGTGSRGNSHFNLLVDSFYTQEVGREYERFGRKGDSDLNQSSHVKYVFEQTEIAFETAY